MFKDKLDKQQCVGFLYGRPGFESRPGTPMEIPLLSVSSEESGVGLND
jgi:hypothetical protein